MGGVLTESSIDKLTARVVAGSANNVLSGPEIERALFERGVTYAPDYLVNAGALIQGVRFLLTGEREGDDAVRRIGDKTRELLETAAQLGEPPGEVLERQILERLKARRSWRQWSWPGV
jgi:glutamate dehydrogenase/leucine dehydrogenase